jgi:hypothetical protein
MIVTPLRENFLRYLGSVAQTGLHRVVAAINWNASILAEDGRLDRCGMCACITSQRYTISHMRGGEHNEKNCVVRVCIFDEEIKLLQGCVKAVAQHECFLF